MKGTLQKSRFSDALVLHVSLVGNPKTITIHKVFIAKFDMRGPRFREKKLNFDDFSKCSVFYSKTGPLRIGVALRGGQNKNVPTPCVENTHIST